LVDTSEVTEEPSDLVIEGMLEQEIQQAICLNALTSHNRGENTILVGGNVKKS